MKLIKIKDSKQRDYRASYKKIKKVYLKNLDEKSYR